MTPNHPTSFDRTEDSTGQTTRYYLRQRLPLTRLVRLLALFILVGNVAAADGHKAVFAEPTSGRKVTHYEIELPVRLDQRETFHIPDDCEKVIRTVNSGTLHRGNIIDRRLWKKTESDCRYNAFLHRHPQHELEDHVSGYDFRNAWLRDLPLDQRCAKSGPYADPAGCGPQQAGSFGMLRHFPIATPAGDAPVMADCIPCRLSNGRFRGYVLIDGEDVRCQTDASAPGVRLIAVDFADINGDRVLDVILRLIPIGPSNNRGPLILPLTRFGDSEPFVSTEPMIPRDGR